MNKKFNIIYADPPWQYKNFSKKTAPRGAAKEYDTLSMADLKALDVASISEKDSVLFLWVTGTHLGEGIDLMREWGFTYKTVAFVWVKTNKKATDTLFLGMGSYTRSNAEYILIGIKGKPKVVNHSVRQIVMSPVEKHSKKPSIFHDYIECLFPSEYTKCELFARETYDDWTVIGEEIDGKDIRDVLKETNMSNESKTDQSVVEAVINEHFPELKEESTDNSDS